MPTYRLPNPSGTGEIQASGSSLQEAQANAAKASGLASWTGGSYGANSLLSGGGGGGSSGGGGGGGGGGGNVRIDPADMAALRSYFGETSGFSREELAEKKRQFDEQMAMAERTWQRQGLPELQIKQQLADLEAEKFRSTLGLDYLKTAAAMGGPADYFQMSDFIRGAQARGDVPAAIGALANNTQLPAFAGSTGQAPIAQTAEGLAARLTGGVPGAGGGGGIPQEIADLLARNPSLANPEYQKVLMADPSRGGQVFPGVANSAQIAAAVARGWNPTTLSYDASRVPIQSGVGAPAAMGGLTPGGYDPNAALNQIGSIFKAGPTSLQPGSLERLDPNELALLKSGATKLGYDPDQWFRAYQKAGVGQRAAATF